ncbi:hypothetical protein AQUCO_01300613v1 [Aquilegia coerulea]|uniref:Uncharacterized protein n=1 Tax=Aquilegia coerulea TaxID=218851 RepID=A0A2G5E2J7_AQUCA|nr:hypothetical protein AQUCO_01300613v1 [Aquilegia coerulea]
MQKIQDVCQKQALLLEKVRPVTKYTGFYSGDDVVVRLSIFSAHCILFIFRRIYARGKARQGIHAKCPKSTSFKILGSQADISYMGVSLKVMMLRF